MSEYTHDDAMRDLSEADHNASTSVAVARLNRIKDRITTLEAEHAALEARNDAQSLVIELRDAMWEDVDEDHVGDRLYDRYLTARNALDALEPKGDAR